MIRTKVVGLCLTAAFVFTAILVSGAQAGQFGHCVKQGTKPYTGTYTDKYCSVKATEAEKTEGKHNKYEWVPQVAPVKFISEGGEMTIAAPGGPVECKHSRDAGEILNATETSDVFTLYECRPAFLSNGCKNAEVEFEGKKVGAIVTYPLRSKLLDHGEKGPLGGEPAEGEVWNSFKAEGTANASYFGVGSWLAAYECDDVIAHVPYAVGGTFSTAILTQYIHSKIKAGKSGKKGKLGKPTYEEAVGSTVAENAVPTTTIEPFSMEVVTAPSYLTDVNLVMIETEHFEKGFEINDI